MNKKILIIVIAAVLTLAIGAVLIFLFAGKGSVPPTDTNSEPSPSQTAEMTETQGVWGETALESFTLLPDDEPETEAQGPVVSPEPLDPEDPYGNVIFDRPGVVVEDPVPEADHEHKWELEDVSSAPDNKKPLTEIYKCLVCGEEKRVYYPPSIHEFHDSVIVPTCTEMGYTAHECALCGYYYRDSYKDAMGHAFGDWKPDGETEKRTCSVCGFTESRTVVPDDAQTMVVSSGEAKPGDTVTLSVSLNNNPGICAFTLSFEYDADALTLESVARSDSLGGQFTYAKKAVWFALGDYKKDGDILSLTFRVSPDAKSGTEYSVSIPIKDGDVCNFNEENVDFTVVSGSVKVK